MRVLFCANSATSLRSSTHLFKPPKPPECKTVAASASSGPNKNVRVTYKLSIVKYTHFFKKKREKNKEKQYSKSIHSTALRIALEFWKHK